MAARGPPPGYPPNALGLMKLFAKEILLCYDGKDAEQVFARYLPLIFEAFEGGRGSTVNVTAKSDSVSRIDSPSPDGLPPNHQNERSSRAQDLPTYGSEINETDLPVTSLGEQAKLQQQNSTQNDSYDLKAKDKAKQLKFDSPNRYSELDSVDNETPDGTFSPNYISDDDADALNSQQAWETGETAKSVMNNVHTGPSYTSMPAGFLEAKEQERDALISSPEAPSGPSVQTGVEQDTKIREQRANEMKQRLAENRSRQANASAPQMRQNTTTNVQPGGWQRVPARIHYPANSQDEDTCHHRGFWARINERLTCQVCNQRQWSFVYRCPSCSKDACADCRREISQS